MTRRFSLRVVVFNLFGIRIWVRVRVRVKIRVRVTIRVRLRLGFMVRVRVRFRVTTGIDSRRCQKMHALCTICGVIDGQSEGWRI